MKRSGIREQALINPGIRFTPSGLQNLSRKFLCSRVLISILSMLLPLAQTQAAGITTIGGEEIIVEGYLEVKSGFYPAGPTREVNRSDQYTPGNPQNDGQENGYIYIRCDPGQVMVGFKTEAWRQGNGDWDLYKFFIKCK